MKARLAKHVFWENVWQTAYAERAELCQLGNCPTNQIMLSLFSWLYIRIEHVLDSYLYLLGNTLATI